MAAPDVLSDRIQEELKRYVFNELPIHLIHLQSAQLCNRETVLEHVLPIFTPLTAQDLPDDLEDSFLNPIPSSADTTNIHDFFHERLRYAILSDKWGEPEPAYGDVPTLASAQNRPAHYNIARFCDIATNDWDVEYAWVDSCCIDRYSDAELNRSIRSTYRWYSNSSICIAHLAESTSVQDLAQDTWFKRGWTLLQLLAPKQLKFYKPSWDPLTDQLNDKQSPDVLAAIQAATSISPPELQNFSSKDANTYHISKRLRWAANRTTTLAEDRAYSLMGVFSVTIDVAYGEGGVRAFSRLFKEIIHFSNSPEAVNWVGEPGPDLSLKSLGYPLSPDAFIGSNDVAGLTREEPVSFAANGLSIKLLVIPAILVRWETDLRVLLRCFGIEVRADCLPDFTPEGQDDTKKLKYALGGWNFSTTKGRCKRSGNLVEAILLYRSYQGSSKEDWNRIPTQSFIRVELNESCLPPGTRWQDLVQTVVL